MSMHGWSLTSTNETCLQRERFPSHLCKQCMGSETELTSGASSSLHIQAVRSLVYLPCPSDTNGSSRVSDTPRSDICRSTVNSMNCPLVRASYVCVKSYGTTLYLCIGIPKFDSDVSLEFVLESDSQDSRYRFHDCRFAVSDMADGPYERFRARVSARDRGQRSEHSSPRLIVACERNHN